MTAPLAYSIRLVAELPAHEDRAWHVSWNPSKPLLASCSADKNVRLYSYARSEGQGEGGGTAKDIKFSLYNVIPTGHTKTVRAVAWSPSGETLATGSFDSNIGIWEQEVEEGNGDESGDGTKKGEWECASLLEGHETECKSVGYSCDGNLLASCSRDKTVWIWEVLPDSEFECVSVLMEHTQDVKCVAWHPTEEILASASYDDTIKLYIDDPSDDWYCFSTLTGHSSTVWSLAWSPMQSYLASGSDDRTIRIWKRVGEHKWESVLVLGEHERSVYSISWGQGKGQASEGEEYLGWLASAGGDGVIRVWEMAEKDGELQARRIAELKGAHDVHDLNAVSFSPRDGLQSLIATAGDDGGVRVWEIASFLTMAFDLASVIRPNILALQPYRCARDDYQSGILLDANENALGHSIATSDLSQPSSSFSSLDLHRYPDPSHPNIKSRIAALRHLPDPNHVFLGNGSDEVIDLLIRIAVTPGKEKILITPPTYGMYAVCAKINDVGIVKIPLQLSSALGEGGERGRFSLQVEQVKQALAADPTIKLVFLCSPGNPTGTLISLLSLKAILDYEHFHGIVVVDEAYIDFASPDASAVSLIREYPNLCVMQTFSKSFGLAAIRLGTALAQPPLIQILSNTKAPYNVSTPTADLALSALSPASIASMKSKASQLVSSRSTLLRALATLQSLGVGSSIGSNNANFVVVPILASDGQPSNERAHNVYKALAEENGVVIRYRGSEPGCTGCVRITIGTIEENDILIQRLRKVLQEI
ncbi:hypothetical protein AX17_004062 [Amanita inopinata Kibby_2008]|nr:hypothetical protein AX17_004062 [Amanita inopinata Kibby_2008]